MKRTVAAYAALIGMSVSVACSNQSGSTGSSNNATPTPTAVLSMPPHLSMTPAPQKNCSQPGASVQFYDAKTADPIPLPNERLVYWLFYPFIPALSSPLWTLENINTKKTRTAVPGIPLIVGEIKQADHDQSTIEVLPLDNAVDTKLVNDEITHIKYTDTIAEQARIARLTGIPAPTPDPSAQAQDNFFLGVPATAVPGSLETPSPVPTPIELQQVASITQGSPPDDTDFQNSPGNPDGQDPHLYDFSCAWLVDSNYALIWRIQTQIQEVTSPAYTAVQATLSANSAQPVEKANVGWVANQYITRVAMPVPPRLVPLVVVSSPSPGALATYIQPNIRPMFQNIACQNLLPLPTPLPSGAAPTSAPTDQPCATQPP